MQFEVISNASTEIDVTPYPEILALLENLNVEPWACLAELCDNALDDFRVNGKSGGEIHIEVDGKNLTITDNGSGMSVNQVESAISAGYSEKGKADELGLFGVGFNVATVGLGRKAAIATKTAADKNWAHVNIDVNEMIRAKSFKLQANQVKLKGKFNHGTIINIELDDKHINDFSRPAFQKTLSEHLGQAYSYILRSSVPGLTGEVSGNQRDVEISLAGNLVRPWIPCIWDEDRTVSYRGSPVNSVSKIDRALPPASVCNDCGYWHMSTNIKICERCECVNLEVKNRRVWGWVGVQRYMDSLEFGINFIRNGRTILFRDRSIFTFSDPTTGEAVQEYPVEWPADQGRIVGELHCDHVGVDFIKRSFNTNDNNWHGARTILHGDARLRPRQNTTPNTSPLAQIFNAYRVNEPGVRYLMPGNGKSAIHQATKNWSRKFQEGDTDYYTDKEWYDAAVSHDTKKSGSEVEPGNPGTTGTAGGPGPSGTNGGPGPSGTAGGPGPTGTAAGPGPSGTTTGPAETMQQKMARWKSGGFKRQDLSKSVTPNSVKKSFALEVWETRSQITDDSGSHLAVQGIAVKGDEIHIFAETHNPVFIKYGRSETDLILMEAAIQIKSLASSTAATSLIFADLLAEFPDEEKSEAVLRARISELEVRLKPRVQGTVSGASSKFWKTLTKSSRDAAEENAMASGTPVVWKEAISNGSFASYLTLKGVNELCEALPNEFLDGKVFKQMYASVHAQQARVRTHGYITKAIQDLVNISEIAGTLNPYEIDVAEHSLDFINKSLTDI